MSILSGSLGDVLEQLVKTIFLMLAVFIILWASLYWLTWTMGKARLDRAITDIQIEMRKEGTISEAYVTNTIDSYCDIDAYGGASYLP